MIWLRNYKRWFGALLMLKRCVVTVVIKRLQQQQPIQLAIYLPYLYSMALPLGSVVVDSPTHNLNKYITFDIDKLIIMPDERDHAYIKTYIVIYIIFHVIC